MLHGHSMRQETDTNKAWLKVFDEYGVQVLVLNRHSDGDLLELCQSQPAWTVDHEDGEVVLLVRVDITWANTSGGPTHNGLSGEAWDVLTRLAYSCRW